MWHVLLAGYFNLVSMILLCVDTFCALSSSMKFGPDVLQLMLGVTRSGAFSVKGLCEAHIPGHPPTYLQDLHSQSQSAPQSGHSSYMYCHLIGVNDKEFLLH